MNVPFWARVGLTLLFISGFVGLCHARSKWYPANSIIHKIDRILRRLISLQACQNQLFCSPHHL